MKEKLNEQMAEGMEVLSVVVLPEKSGSAMAAVAAAEARAEERQCEEEGECEKRVPGRPIYKGELIRGRENQGYHGVVISPSRRLDSRNDSKSKDPLRIWRSKKRT